MMMAGDDLTGFTAEKIKKYYEENGKCNIFKYIDKY
jgi:hypothetical protein